MKKRFTVLLASALALNMIPIPINSAAAVAVSPITSEAGMANTAVPALSGMAFKQILTGNYYSVALRQDGTVWTWGRNLWNELGVMSSNTITRFAAPVRLRNLKDITSITTNGAGMQLGLRKDGTVWEWGAIYGMSGSQLPKQVEGLNDIAAAVALRGVGVALHKDGKLTAWSHDRNTGNSRLTSIPGTYKLKSLISYGSVVLALDDEGRLWAAGASLEEGDTVSVTKPSQLKGIPAMKQISIRSNYAQMFGVDVKGNAWTWKLDPDSIYNGTDLAKLRLSGKPAKIYPSLKVKEIQAGNYGILLTEGGEVWALDKGPTGQTGRVNGLTGIVSIASTDRHNLVLDGKGQIWGWGANQWNETGNVRTTSDGMVYRPALIQAPINTYINGEWLASSYPTLIDQGITWVPLKDVVQAAGASLSSENGIHTITYRQSKAVINIYDRVAEVNNTMIQLLKAFPQSVPGVTMIPVRILKELGIHASWDSKSYELRLTTS